MTQVVSCFIIKNNKMLILKRSAKVRSFKGKWATVSGYLESGENASATALKEIKEEINLKGKDLEFVRKGDLIYINEEWVVHPYLFKAKSNKIKIDWEHVEYKWIKPEELKNYDTVPKLKEALESALGYD